MPCSDLQGLRTSQGKPSAPWTQRITFAGRRCRRLADRLRLAKLKQAACLEDLDLHTPRQLDRALVLKLADCQWAADHLNILITGPTEYTLSELVRLAGRWSGQIGRAHV